MNRRYFLTGLLAFTVLPACSTKVQYKKVEAGQTVVALGDSLTFGYGASASHSYPAKLAKKTGWKIINAGVNGDTTENVLVRLDTIIAQKPALTLLCIGGNDVLRKVPSAVTQENLTAIINRLNAQKIPVVLIAQPHLSASALIGKASDNPVYERVAKQTKVPLFAKSWSRILSDNSLKSDQIHANEAGYTKFANELYEFLKDQGFVG